MSHKIIHGAEARVEPGTYLGRAVLHKRRVAKTYRHAALDARLRAERTRDEATLLLAARRAGVPVPVVYDIDRTGATLSLEVIEGPALRSVLATDAPQAADARMAALGAMVAHLHAAGLTHGDLTTSNVLVPGSLVLIDFGLGQVSVEDEDRAVDLHLMEEALEATEPRAQDLFAAFIGAYQEVFVDAERVLRRLEAVRDRGRYRGAG